MSERKIRVLIVDDSAIAREIIERGLSQDPQIEIVGKAGDVFSARDKIVFLDPDVITLDIEMPKMSGIEFLKRLMPQKKVRAIVVSSLTEEGSRHALEALDAGAISVVAKPRAQDRDGFMVMILELADRIKEAILVDLSKLKGNAPVVSKNITRSVSFTGSRIIVIGASTGGTVALNKIIPELPANIPGTVIVQHMPPIFTRMFAESLDKISKARVIEAKDGDKVIQGKILVAPGDLQVQVIKSGVEWYLECKPGDKVSGHRPSVDVLFNSVAKAAGSKAVGVVLTGMGKDGADGLLTMRKKGSRCLAQDEASSVVFGMPKEAFTNGGAEKLVSLDKIAAEILMCLDQKPRDLP